MQYVQQNGQTLEQNYTYTARDGTCRASQMTSSVGVTRVNQVRARSQSSLLAAIANGPTSVTVEADRSVFQRYTGGVLNSSACGTQLDHAITAVGYGVQNGVTYYIVRNSWGASWGDRGYINIAASGEGSTGICGIQQTSVWPNTS
mgnify:CR=1 FL=1